jgi:acetolactate synthase-1/2/3 large subunit
VTGAEALVRALEHAGVEVAFGLPGVHNLAAWEALAESSIRLIGVRHEQAAVYAADGYARATGRVGVAITTTGPGAANTLGACGEAWASRSPVLVIATDISTTVRREGVWRGTLHECTDQAAMFAPVVDHVVRVPDADRLAHLVRFAVTAPMIGPRRPIYLEIPTNLLTEEAREEDLTTGGWSAYAGSGSPADLDAAAALLAEARRPLVWAGGGAVASGAGPAVAALAERLDAPVLTTYSARGLLGTDHPLAVGLPPHLPRVGTLWDEADAVVAIGSDLDGMMTQNWAMPQPPRLVAINIDPADATKNYHADVVLAADARAGAAALAERLRERPTGQRAAELAELRAAAREDLRAAHPEEVAFLEAFAAAMPDDAVVVCDMCIPGYWLGALHPVPAPRRLLYPLGWGTLGCAFPQALGAALAGGGPAVSVSGDGGFLFACGELATAAQERIPLTAVIVDDGGYGMLRFDQERAGTQAFGVDLHTPDFAALARSFGVRAERVDGLGADFSRALAEHVATAEPSVLVASARLQPPPTTSPRWYRR